ncbi:antibiotic biosynthesis monooxygenase [Streptomyces sp. NPDC052107]|uniref:antibiotic biosynthesis monooxygenase n=1 Tax=Streptomyces sp. NPDC052107 TaxID=3155632 RepID=UPI00341461F9
MTEPGGRSYRNYVDPDDPRSWVVVEEWEAPAARWTTHPGETRHHCRPARRNPGLLHRSRGGRPWGRPPHRQPTPATGSRPST